jgi:hypothetical protein
MENQQIFPEFKDEDVIGVIKYIGDKVEFLNFAKDLAVKIFHKEIPVDVSKQPTLHLYRTTCTMYIMGTVKGVERNEIIFVKNKSNADTEQRQDIGTVG